MWTTSILLFPPTSLLPVAKVEIISLLLHIIIILLPSDVLYNSQVVFAVGEVSSGRIECRNVSLDNNVLEWSWQLTVELEQPHHNQHIILKDPYNLPLIVIDDEGK